MADAWRRFFRSARGILKRATTRIIDGEGGRRHIVVSSHVGRPLFDNRFHAGIHWNRNSYLLAVEVDQW